MKKRVLGSRLSRAVVESLETRRLLSVNVLTWHNDNTRQGQNTNEQILTPSNVSSNQFGELFSYSVTGQVYAQPLYVSGLNIPGRGTLNVVYVATMNNDVYCFNADSNSGVGEGLIWHVNLGPAAVVPSQYIGARYGPDHDTTPQVGITSTPVIDLSTGTMFVDSFTNDVAGQDVYSHHIHALDLTTGADKMTPMLVTASVKGNGVGGNGTTVTFAADKELQRVALTLLNGTLYVAYGAYADTDPYHGWVLGFNESNLQLTSVLCTTPNLLDNGTSENPGESGIWQSGAGLASDGTHLFFITGNGDFENSVGDYGDSFVEVSPDTSTGSSPDITGYGLGVNDFFTPYNQLALANADADLGSGGAMLLPTQSGANPDELVGAGKQGTVYLVNRDNMGGNNASTDNVIQTVSLGHGEWGSPAYFNGSIYYHAVGDVLKRFSLTNGLLSAAPAASATITYNSQGATPSISSNGTSNGIVWDVQWDASHQVLHAYDATTLNELYDSNQVPARDQMDAGVKFITPTIANGHVYVGTSDGLYVYGELTPVTTAPAAPSNASATALSASSVLVTWVDNSNNENAFLIERSTDNTNFTQIGTSSANTPNYIDSSVAPNSTYYYRIRAMNAIGDSGYTTPSTSVTTPTATGATDIYHFDEGGGSTTADAQNNNSATLTGTVAPQWVAGKVGPYALSFSGDGIYNQSSAESAVKTAGNLAPVLGSTSTLDFWIKTSQAGNSYHYEAPAVTGVEQAGGANDINWGTLDATGHIGLYVGDAGGVYSTYPINDNQWHNVALTRNASTGVVQIYVDGVLNGSSTLDTGSKTTPFNLIGGLSDVAADGVTFTGANYFNGQLDEVRIYSAILGQAEIDQLSIAPGAPTLQSVTVQAGPVVHLAFTSLSYFAQSLEIDRKVGVNGTFAAYATVSGSATTYDDTSVSTGVSYYYRVIATDNAGASPASATLGVTPPAATVVGNYAFYNNSHFDADNGSSNLADDFAIATDKTALLNGQTASSQNITGYSKGINGIMVDVANLVNLPRLDDFEFMVGNVNDPSSWTQAPTPTVLNSYPGRGPGGSTQITIIWDDNAIQNEWLQVTVLAQPHLNLTGDDVFYFGNAIGYTGTNPNSAQVTSADVSAIASHQTSNAAINNPYDLNRDGVVDGTDISIAQSNLSTPGNALNLIALTTHGTLPTVVNAANASSSTVTTTTVALAVLGGDSGGESNLTYTWSTIGTPPAVVNFSVNGTNAAKHTTATFLTAGSYVFQVQITNGSGYSVTSNVTVQVNQSMASVVVSPATASVAVNSAIQLSATALDQFGLPMATQPAFTWAVTSGSGTVTSSGLFTATRSAGTASVQATASGTVSGTTNLTVFYDALAWYQMDTITAGALTDSSPFNQTATLTGNANLSTGVSGSALNLTGGYASLPAGIVSSLNDFTIAAWVKPATLSDWQRVFDFGAGTTDYMFLTTDDGATLRFAILNPGSGGEQQLNGPAMSTNVWTHIAITLAGNTGTLYVNGAAYATNTAMTLHPTDLGVTNQNYIGKSQFAGDPAFNGAIDDFRICSYAMTAQQIAQLAAPGIVNAPAASPVTVTGTTTSLSVLGSDVTAGESALTYTWSATGSSPAPVNFSVNGTNAAKNTVATFSKAGNYSLQVIITNPLTPVMTTGTVNVTVVQTPSGFTVSPSTLIVAPGTPAVFMAGTIDQFGNLIAGSAPSVNWSVISGGGTINSQGVYTAPGTAGAATIQASGSAGTSKATVTISTNIAWYKADASTGATLTDSSGNNRTANLLGSYSWTTGVEGNAIALSGGNANLPTGIVSSLGDFTISAWINVTTLSNWERIFDFGTGTGTYMFLTPDAGGTNALRFAITTSGNGNEQRLDGPAIATGVWTHVAVTLAGTVGTLYVNGVAVATNTGMTLHPSSLGNTNQNYLGKSQFADPAYQGAIDDFRIYNMALSPQQVLALAAPTVLAPPAAATAPVTGTSTTLSVQATDLTAGASALTFNWSTVGTPPAAVAFSRNGTNAAQSTTATFTSAGTYTFQVSIENPTVGVVTTSTVSVVVVQTITTIAVTPSATTVFDGQSSQFSATAYDQFGAAQAAQPTFTWSVVGTGGINSTGLYTAPAAGAATDTVKASAGSISGSSTANVTLSVINGTAGNNTIRLVRSGANLLVYLNAATPTYNVSFGTLSGITITSGAGGGIDSINLDFSGGASPVPSGGIAVNGSGGITTLVLTGSSGADTAILGAASLTLDGSAVTFINLSGITFNGNGGADTLIQTAQPTNHLALVFNGTASGGTSSLDTLNISGGTYSFPAPIPQGGFQPITLANLIVGNGAAVVLGNGLAVVDRSVLVLNSLSLAPMGRLDLGSNDLILHNVTASAALNALGSLSAALQSGRNTAAGGNWQGPGIDSSAASTDSTHLTTMGVILNSTLSSFDSQAVSSTDVLVKYTYYGDANLGGNVDASDYTRIDNGYLQHLTGWGNGDFNYDGVVNGSDYTLIDNAFNTQGNALPSAMLATEIAPPRAAATGHQVKAGQKRASSANCFSTAPIGQLPNNSLLRDSVWKMLQKQDLLERVLSPASNGS